MPIYTSNKEVYELVKKSFPIKTRKDLEKPGGILSRNKRARIAGVREIRSNRDFHKVWNAILDEAEGHKDLTPRKLSALKYMVKTSERAQRALNEVAGANQKASTSKKAQSALTPRARGGVRHSSYVADLRSSVAQKSDERRNMEETRRQHGPRPATPPYHAPLYGSSPHPRPTPTVQHYLNPHRN